MTNGAEPKGVVGNKDWQVPAHKTVVLKPKSSDYALVIPVIDEGERIRAQLQRIRDAQLPVDVIVADGGSTDGSLEGSLLVGAGVRALQIKVGPGKLSAQLRMAYAWCLEQGYDGIVTIDGNGKDGVEAIPTMVQHLREGYDYLQGSRYAPGGQAENTPLDRMIGNRLIHAPLLSIAGRRWLTDTTNGFRGYSARFLLHPDVKPFRDVFVNYELLFYLTVRAGQVGMRVCEVPVRRTYPKEGRVPTKIHGLDAKKALLLQTIRAVFGAYSPTRNRRSW